jgi:hypothetical protein
MSDNDQTVYTGKMGAYDANPDSRTDWDVTVDRSTEGDRLTLTMVDASGLKREIVVEINGEHPQIIAYGEMSDEPLMIARVGHAEAVVYRNEPDPNGVDYIRLDENGIKQVDKIELTAAADILSPSAG